MGREYPEISDALLRAILQGDAEEIEEKLYAAQKTVPAALGDLETGTVPGDFIGIIMGLACCFDVSTTYYLKVAEKDRYENGLTAAGMSEVAVGNGVGPEIFLGEFVDENQQWKLQGIRTAGALAQNYRLRVRYYKKGSILTQAEQVAE